MENMIKRENKFPAFCSGDIVDQFVDDLFGRQLFEKPQPYPVDIVEVKDENGDIASYEVIVALAGIPKENIGISVDNDILDISVDKVEKTETDTRTYVSNGISRRSASFRYSLHGVDIGKIVSNFADGVLTVKIPLAEESKPRKITIG